jgi:transcriptional regulator of acetoin/glycerol metabolism
LARQRTRAAQRSRSREATGAEAPVQERNRVLSALVHSNWNKSKIAETLRLSRMTLYRKMSNYSIGLTRRSSSPSNTARFYRDAI